MTIFRAHQIPALEAKFKTTLNAAGRQFKSVPGEFPGVTNLLLPPSARTFYYQEIRKKERICQHLTHGILTGDIYTLTQPNNHVSTSYVVARDGTVYRIFPDEFHSYHLGANTSAPNSIWSPKSIGIEASCLGPLIEDKADPSILIDTYGKAYCSKTDTQLYRACNYRSYKFFATLTDEQYAAINSLVANLCKKHGIAFSRLPTDAAFNYFPKIPSAVYYFH